MPGVFLEGGTLAETFGMTLQLNKQAPNLITGSILKCWQYSITWPKVGTCHPLGFR